MQSVLENQFAFACKVSGIAKPQTQYRFDPVRRWRFDFAWPEQRVAVEIDGGLHCRGRHIRPEGYKRDCEKLNAAVLANWRVLRFVADQIKSGDAVAVVLKALGIPEKQKFIHVRRVKEQSNVVRLNP